MTTDGEVGELQVVTLRFGPKVREQTDFDHVAAMASSGVELPPISVRKVGNAYFVLDGRHRVEVAKRNKQPTIRAVVHKCDDAEALALAVHANVAHGKPLSLAERKKAAATLVKLAPDWSDARLAAQCGLGDKTVAALRPTSENPRLDTRVGADGRKRPGSRFDASQRRADAKAALDAKPTASDREVALRTGLSPSTVAKVRQQNEEPVRLKAVPETSAEPTVGDLLGPRSPVPWVDDERCRQNVAGHQFALFMDRFTYWNRKHFGDHLDAATANCPGDLTAEALDAARSMVAGWNRFIHELENRRPMEAAK